MTYEIGLINPCTGEQKCISATITGADLIAAATSCCFQSHVQNMFRDQIPDGFMPIGNGVKPVILQ